MRYWKYILAPAIVLAVGCGRNDRQASADSALNSDLSLANQRVPGQDTLGAAERLNGAGVVAGSSLRSTSRPTTKRRTTTARRSSTSSGGTVTTSGGNVSTSRPSTVVQKNTKRDAAIGAAAGAVIGATTSKDKLKGAVIGGVVGGILGGVIGNNVDVKKKKPPQE